MTVKELAEKLGMKVAAGDEGLNREITGVYACDLLSWVMSHAGKGDAWITVLTNLNTVAVALLTEVACIILPEGIQVEEGTAAKALQEGIVILQSRMGACEISWKAHELLKTENNV